MEIGQSGQNGAIVILIVTRRELENARTQPHLKEGLTALETPLRQILVVVEIVGVNLIKMMSFFLNPINFYLVFKNVYLLSDLKQINNRLIFLESYLPKGCFYTSQVFEVFEEIEMEDNSPCTCTRYCQQYNYTLAHMKAG